MLEQLLPSFSLLIPIVCSGLVLIACIKRGWLEPLNKPIDGGRSWRGQPIFGRNKTLRGVVVHFVVAIIVTILISVLASQSNFVSPAYQFNPIILGAVFASAYIMGELVNSFIKRRLGIRAGGSAKSTLAYRLQYFFDTSDGIVAVGILLLIIYRLDWLQAALAVALGCIVHVLIDSLMRGLGLKKRQEQRYA